MKICFIVGTLGRGGAERQLIYMLQALQSENVAVRVLCLTKGESFEQEIKNLGIDVEWVGSSQNKIIRLGRIINILRKDRPDILQSSHFYTNLYAAIAGRILNIRNIGAIRNDLNSEITSNGLYGRWQLFLPEHLIANSESANKRIIAKGIPQEKLDFVRNIVPAKNGSRGLEIKNGINILFAGRLCEQKRPEAFIRLAFRMSWDLADLPLYFQIAGDGPLRSELEQLARSMTPPRKNIRFLGEQEDMSQLYQEADILVLTSAYEGTPNVILEAMAYGIPVVSTKVGGIPEILDDTRGFLVEPEDNEGLIKATSKLILNKDLRDKLGTAGREYVLKNHSFDYLKDKLISIYRRLLRK
jgi:L-malate glycosyltransferase